MSMAFVQRGWILLLTTPSAMLLWVWVGVGGWMWPISARCWRMGTALRALMYKAPSSVSAAKDITALMSWAMLRTALLLLGSLMSDDMKK
jgi:hypothetical protein